MRFYAGARIQAQQPEGTGGVAVEMLIGPGEYRANSRSRIASAAEQAKPLVTVAQLPHQPDKRYRRTSGGEVSPPAACARHAAAALPPPPGPRPTQRRPSAVARAWPSPPL